MTVDGRSPLPNNPYRSVQRKTFKKVVKDDDSSTPSSSSNSDSASGSSSSSSSSSDGSSVEVLYVKKPLKPSESASESTKSPYNHFDTSSSEENGSRVMEATNIPKSTAPSTAVTNNASTAVDEFANFDDDEFPWFDEPDDDERPSDLPGTVVVESSHDTVPAINEDLDHGDDQENVTRDASESTGNTSIGPFYQSGRKAEVDPVLYAPPQYHPKQPPIVHQLSLRNRPKHMRKDIPVNHLFKSPVSTLWRSKFDKFNPLQSEVSTVLVNTNDTVVVSAPTGAGKTAVFEMAMARHISSDLEVFRESSDWRQKQLPSCRKILYIAPSKALCEERYEDWSRRLSELKLGIRTAMITGDAEQPGDTFRDIATSHLILTTPEKWDSLTRRWTENFVLFGSVKLVLIDEVHLLGDASRGSCLESVVCRMKTIFRATQACEMTESQIKTSSFAHTTPDALASHLRIVAVSATLPNIGDIAAFLDANEAFVFDDSYRPVPLTTHVAVCGDAGNNQFMFNKNMNHKVPGVIRQFSKDKPTIVFCHTKKETEVLASELSRLGDLGLPADNPRLAGQTSISGLQRCLLRGVAYHNAGLDVSDRKLVEKAFLEGKIKCLCATSTLAVGVNLPAHLVVIKGTSAWRGTGAGYSEVDKGSLLQMIGRAGRAGFDTSGTAVIMTESKNEQKYKELGASLEIVESQLLPKLVQVLNNEISQKVITTFQSAKEWLATTFLFQRIKRNPDAFGIKDPKELDQCLTRICGAELKKLDDVGCIEVSKHQNGDVTPLFGCHVMSQHLVDFSAMKLIIELPFTSNTGQLLATISQFEGLHKPVRRSEKKHLNEVHKAIKYKLEGPPSKVRVQEPYQKAFVLLQAAIGQHFFEDFTLRREMSSNVEFSTRMLAAAEEYSIYGSKKGQVALQSLKLRRSLAVSLWGSGDGVMNQLRGVGQEATGRLRFNNITSFIDVLNAKEEAIEKAAGRSAPFGSELRKAVYAILRNSLKMSAYIPESLFPENGRWVTCQLFRNDKIPNDAFSDSTNQSVTVKYTLIAFTDRPNGCLFFQSNVEDPGEFRFRCPDKFGKIWVHLVSSLVGLDESVVIEGNDEVFASALSTTAQSKGKRNENSSSPKTSAKDAKESNTSAKVRRKNKTRIRDPNNSLQDGFKRQAAQRKSTPKRSLSTAVTPSPAPPQMARRLSPAPSATSEFFSPNGPVKALGHQRDNVGSAQAWHRGNTPSGSDSQRDHGRELSPQIQGAHQSVSRCQQQGGVARRLSSDPSVTAEFLSPDGPVKTLGHQRDNVGSAQAWHHGNDPPGSGSQKDHGRELSTQIQAHQSASRHQQKGGDERDRARQGAHQYASRHQQHVGDPRDGAHQGYDSERRRDHEHGRDPSRQLQEKQNFSANKKSPRPDDSWKKQKREQKTMQKSAFRKDYENPFAKFQYDPNDAENNLDTITNENSSISANRGSILPPDAFAKARPRQNVFQKGPTRMRSKRGSPHTRRVGSNSQSIPSHMVLRMKAEEQLCYAGGHSPMQDNPYHNVPYNGFEPQPPGYAMHEANPYNRNPQCPGSSFPIGVSHSVSPHRGGQQEWGSTQPGHYQPVGPQTVFEGMGPMVSQHNDGYGGDPWQHYQMEQRGFGTQQGDRQAWVSPQGFHQGGAPHPGQEPCYQPDYMIPRAQAPEDNLLEDAFF